MFDMNDGANMEIPRENAVRRLRLVPAEINNRLENQQVNNELEAKLLERRRGNSSGTVLDTIGTELESLALQRDFVSNLLAYKMPKALRELYQVHRDGSSEIHNYLAKLSDKRLLRVNSHTESAGLLFSRNSRPVTSGYELISIPMDIETAEYSYKALLPLLKASGDFLSPRCATHLHVGAMKNLSFMKNVLAVGLWFDEVFFSISGMGRKFRGYSNNANYARPLQSGPYIAAGDSNYYQILNHENALKANSIFEFFACYGIDVDGELPKYHPARYFSINEYSVMRIGTLEFRHFNQTFNPELLTAVAKLCQLFTEICIKIKFSDAKELQPGNVFETHSTSYYLDKLYRLLDLANLLDCQYSLSNNDINELTKVISIYTGIGIQDVPVMTHCRDVRYDPEIIKLGKLKRAKTKPIPAGQVDIHNIKYSSIMEEQ